MRFDLPAYNNSPDSGKRVDGVMVGIVTNNKDPEKFGRVKLKLPIREIEHETDWARVSTFMAGKERGSLFVPEVGDEVLVAFHLGDINQPFVIGALWSKKQAPPPGNDKNDIRMIRSRLGHEIVFNDDSANGSITIHTKAENKIELSDKSNTLTVTDKNGKNKITVKGGTMGEIEIKSGNSKIVMSEKGDIAISSDKEIKLKSTMVHIESQGMMDIKAGGALTLKAGAAMDIKADGLINIKGTVVKIN